MKSYFLLILVFLCCCVDVGNQYYVSKKRPTWTKVNDYGYYRIIKKELVDINEYRLSYNKYFKGWIEVERWTIDCASWSSRHDDVTGWSEITPESTDEKIAIDNCP